MTAKTVIFCLDTAECIDRVYSLRRMNKNESKIKVVIGYGKAFLQVSHTITDDFKSSPSGSAFKLSGAKRTMHLAVFQAHSLIFRRLCL